jgi:ADP-ribose pyrophosphatase
LIRGVVSLPCIPVRGREHDRNRKAFPNSANHTNVTYCFLATGVERVAEPMAEDTERVETVLMPLTAVIELAKQGGLLQALHIGSLFFALHTLGELRAL